MAVTAPRGWPDDWQERKAGHDCALCETLGQGDNDHTVHVATLPFAEVGLERRSVVAGYCIVTFRLGHVAEAFELDGEISSGYWSDVVRVARAVDAVFNPMKINLMMLGNWVPHLHTHVVPRYADDPAPGGPITWSDLFRDEPADEVSLRDHAERLREAMTR
jgi:diadenosine tetraphosphate (Ap4A) HIT family hydrolase